MSKPGELPSAPIGHRATAGLLLAYFFLALWGTEVLGGRTAPTALIWPASGVGLALVLLRGTRIWPLIAVAAAASSLLARGAGSATAMVTESLLDVATSTLEPLIAAWLVWKVAGEAFAERAPPFVLAMLVGVPVAAFAAAAPLVAGQLSAGLSAATMELGMVAAWYSAAVSNLMGMLVLTPPIWIWLRHPREGAITGARALELLLFAAAVLVVFVAPEAAQARYLLVAIHLAIALRHPLKWSAAAVALTSAAYLVLAALELRGQPSPDLYSFFLDNIAFVITLNLGTYVAALLHLETRKRAAQLGELADHLGQAEERERKRISTILHDDLQQLLVAAKLELRPDSSRNQRARTRIDNAIEVARTLTAELHPPALDDRSFATALDWLAWQTQELTGIEVRVEAEAGAEPGSPGVRAFVFQGIRELLMNVAKHAGSGVAWVRLRQADGWLQAEVEDRGKGCDPGQFERSSGASGYHGASSLKQRVQLLGGRFAISGESGCRIAFSVPVGELQADT